MQKMNKKIRDAILYVFEQGLDENAMFRGAAANVRLLELVDFLRTLETESLEYYLVELMIKDLIEKE